MSKFPGYTEFSVQRMFGAPKKYWTFRRCTENCCTEIVAPKTMHRISWHRNLLHRTSLHRKWLHRKAWCICGISLLASCLISDIFVVAPKSLAPKLLHRKGCTENSCTENSTEHITEAFWLGATISLGNYCTEHIFKTYRARTTVNMHETIGTFFGASISVHGKSQLFRAAQKFSVQRSVAVLHFFRCTACRCSKSN